MPQYGPPLAGQSARVAELIGEFKDYIYMCAAIAGVSFVALVARALGVL